MASLTGGGNNLMVAGASRSAAEADRLMGQSFDLNADTTEDSIQADVHINAANSAAKKSSKIQVP